MSKSQNAARSVGKLIVLTSHPIQYQAPLWRALAAEAGGRLPFEIWFLTDQGVRHTEDRDFGKAFAWDVDLLSGYPQRFLELDGKWDLRKFNGIPLAKRIGDSLRGAGATALWVEGWRFKPFWDAINAAKRLRIPVFLRGETSDKIAEKGGFFGLARNIALHRLFAKVDYFLAIGQASRRFYLKHGVPERKLIDAPYCVDNEFFRRESGKIRGLKDQETKSRVCETARGTAEGKPNEAGARSAHSEGAHFDNLTDRQKIIRKEWGIPLGAKVVMFCGKFVGKKRPMDVVLAARAHFDRDNVENLKYQEHSSYPWHLLFVGSGELGDELRAACEVRFDGDCKDDKFLKSPNIGAPPASFVGFLNQAQISKAYAVADVLVLPSEAWETWGLVVNEATAAGVPTVISDRCGCSDDFLAKNPYARIFPVSDVAAMTLAIKEVLRLNAHPGEVTKQAEAFSPKITAEAVARLVRV